MVRDPLVPEDSPDLQPVLSALDAPACRRIVRQLDEPMTASQLSDPCDIHTPTTYRILDGPTEASIPSDQSTVRTDTHHTSEDSLAFEEVKAILDEDDQFEVVVTRPGQSGEQRLAGRWATARKET